MIDQNIPPRSPTGVILGAGFSYVAGLPLAKDLFDSELFIPSAGAERRFATVLQAWQSWQTTHPGQGPEQFLTELYRSGGLGLAPWPWASELVAAALATPLPHDRGAYQARYAGRITRPVNVPAHDAFWSLVLSRFAVAAVVTANYDLLAERGLRHCPMQRPKRPGMYYGGLARPQLLKGAALPFSVTKAQRQIELEGSVPLFKLHGSLSWGREAGELAFYQDSRPAFRRGGDAQIIPPVLEKEAPRWLINVWNGARDALSRCSTWIVCGYSLPEYDHAITELLAGAAAPGVVAGIYVLDPNSHNLLARWKAVAPRAEIRPLPGLPDGVGGLMPI